MGLSEITDHALDARRTKPRVGQTVIYYIDGPSDGRVRAGKVVHVIDRDSVVLQLADGRQYTAVWARAPRPPGSWDFIV